MTEAEWLQCSNVLTPEVTFQLQGKGRTSDRKLRLFACACCRHVWNHIAYAKELSEQDQVETRKLRKAVQISERFADGEAAAQELAEAAAASLEAATKIRQEPGPWAAHCTTSHTMWTEASFAQMAAWRAAAGYAAATKREPGGASNEAETLEKSAQAVLLRDILGPQPFRTVTAERSWRTAVAAQALAIYDERAFDRLPALATALEQAGCKDTEILDHCRQPGVHVRGCWVVDLLLAKT